MNQEFGLIEVEQNQTLTATTNYMGMQERVKGFGVDDFNKFYLELFINRYRDDETGLINKTGVAYKRELNNMLIHFKGVRLDQIDFYLLNEYCDTIKYGNAALATKTRIITTIRSFFAFLCKDGINAIKINVAKLIELPKSKDSGETPVEHVLNEQEVQSFFAVVRESGNNRDYMFCSILLSTGVRIDELCKANWCDIKEDMYGNVGLTVLGKGGKTRIVKLRNDIWKRIREYRESIGKGTTIDPNDKTPLILNYKGDRLSDRYIRKVIAEYASQAEINKPVSPHWFRHTSATLSLMGGANVEDVRKMLGHSTLQHTTRYLHNVQGLKETASDHIKVAF